MMKIREKLKNVRSVLKTLKRIFKYLFKSNPKYIVLNLVIMIIMGLTPVMTIKLMQKLMNYLQSPEIDISKTLVVVLLYVSLDLISTLLVSIDNYYKQKFNIKFTGEIDTVILEKTEGLLLKQFEDPQIYNMIQRADKGGGGQLLEFYLSNIGMLRQIITLVSTAIVIIMWKWWMIIVISIVPVFLYFKMLRLSDEQYVIHRERTEKERFLWYIKYILTKDGAFKEIKQNNLNNYFVQKYKKIYSDVVISEVGMIKKRFKISSLLAILDQIVIGFIFIYILFEAFYKRILIGDTLAYINCVSKVKDSVISVLTSIVSIYNESLYINQLFEYLDLKVDVSKATTNIECIDLIEIKHLYYRYKHEQDYVLKDINLVINKNETVGIIGKNGSGKTTLIKILSGFYDDYEGEVLFNGINLKYINKSTLRKLTAILFQDFTKYELSLRENIGLGDISKVEEDNGMTEVLRKARFKKFSEVNFDIQLGNWFNGGIQLSGGEWQKIAISRTLFKNSEFIILDEPTAALDPISRRELYNNIEEDLKNKISIIITHKICEIESITDNIVILDNGEIIDSGTHMDLIKRSEIYRNMS